MVHATLDDLSPSLSYDAQYEDLDCDIFRWNGEATNHLLHMENVTHVKTFSSKNGYPKDQPLTAGGC